MRWQTQFDFPTGFSNRFRHMMHGGANRAITEGDVPVGTTWKNAAQTRHAGEGFGYQIFFETSDSAPLEKL
jgi:hypothetical protein